MQNNERDTWKRRPVTKLHTVCQFASVEHRTRGNAYGLPLCHNIVPRTGLNARYPLRNCTGLCQIVREPEERWQEGERERERKQHQLQTFPGHVATAAKLLTSDWPLEETGLTAPATLSIVQFRRDLSLGPQLWNLPPSSSLLFPVVRFHRSVLLRGEKKMSSALGRNPRDSILNSKQRS